jgi:hypothetical protein
MRHRRLLVSLHDVHPGNLEQALRDLDRLRERGVASPALFVVPFYHGRRPIHEEPAFLERLREREARGAEIFMHGYRHLRSEALGEAARRGLFGKWINGRVGNEGEFAGLDAEQAGELLRKGFDLFARCSLAPAGFALPAWLGKIPRAFPWPESCRFLDARFFIWDLRTGKRLWAPALTFGRNRAGEPFAYGGALWPAYWRRSGLARVALHPGDLEHALVRSAVEAALAGGNTAKYGEVFRR